MSGTILNARRPPARVAVAGVGLVPSLAALAVRRALPRADVVLVPAPADPAEFADRLPVLLPAARAAAARLGLDADRLAERGMADHRLGDAFVDWGAPGPWVHAVGRPPPVGAGAFHQHWLAARRRGAVAPYHAHLPAAVLALADRAPSGVPPAPAGEVDHALRLHPAGVADALARQFAAVRIAVSARLAGVLAPDGERIDALALADGGRLEADLFLDCTGAPARLIGALAGGGEREDWLGPVGVDRLLLAPAAEGPRLLDAYRATDAGWRCTVPLPGAPTAYGAWRSERTGEGRARRSFAIRDGGEAVAFAPGRLVRPSRGNVVALGAAAAQPGPMLALGLSLAVLQLDLLVSTLPGLPVFAGERDEYNRRANLLADRARDLAALPVVASQRRAGPFWAESRAGSDALERMLALFRHRGVLPRPEEDLVEPESWHALLLGLGIVPDLADPVAAAAGGADAAAALRAIPERLSGWAARLPQHGRAR